MNFIKVFILCLASILVVVFQNCGPKVNFKAESSQSEPPPALVTPQSQTRTPAASTPPPPPLTLLQKVERLCPNTKNQQDLTWSKVDWSKPESDSSSSPPCLIKEIYSLYLVEKCSDAGFTSLGETLNTGNNIYIQLAKNIPEFSFPSSGGNLFANVMNAGNFSARTGGHLLFNTLQMGQLNLAGADSCVIANKSNRIISDAFTKDTSTRLAFVGLKVNNLKGTLDFLHMKNLGSGSHEVFIVDANVKVVKIESKYITLNLKNTIITTLCTKDNTIITAAEESGVGTYISDLTDPRCNPAP